MKKTCNKCHETKPVSEFYKRGDKNGYRPNCKECFRARNNSVKGAARISATKEKEAMERDPYGFLAERVIEQAVLDKDAGFFDTWWYEMLRDTASIEERTVLLCREHVNDVELQNSQEG